MKRAWAKFLLWFDRGPGLAEMPPTPHKVPGLPVDSCSLTDHERVKFWLTTAAYRYVEADDPMEGRKL